MLFRSGTTSDTIISESKMKTPRESNRAEARIADVPVNRILILTLAGIKAGKVTKHMTTRSHKIGIVDDLRDTIGTPAPIRATLSGIHIAKNSDHNREEHHLVTALELQAAQPLEPFWPRHGIVRVVSVLVVIKLNRILIRSL